MLLGYALGEAANSLVTNGLITFGLLCYTNALGLSPARAGAALAVSILVEALTQPLVGHISDHIRSRWGRRHPYLIAGGLLMATGFYFAWAVPPAFRNQPNTLFGYLMGLHVLLRLSQNIFYIPYLALGYEITRDDRQQAELQSFRQVFNMAGNLAGPALAWTIFFRNHGSERGTGILDNYIHMGAVFSGAMLIFILVMVVSTWGGSGEARGSATPADGCWRRYFLGDLQAVLWGPYVRPVLVFLFVFTMATVVMGSLQQYFYEHCLHISGWQKTVAHGSTMVSFAIGALVAPKLMGQLDKRRSLWVGGLVSIGCNLFQAILFLPGLLPEGVLLTFGPVEVSLSLATFVPLHAGFWFGVGIVFPVVNTMMADVAEMNRLAAGVNRDGSHAAAFNLTMQLAVSMGLMLAGGLVTEVGFSPGPGRQSPETIGRLAAAMFLTAPAMILLSLLTIYPYCLTRKLLEQSRGEAGGAGCAGASGEN